MTWPTTNIPTTNVDLGTDSPGLARADIKQAFDTLNAIKDHVHADWQELIAEAKSAALKTYLDTLYQAKNSYGNQETFIIAISDETTAITTGTAKVTFHMPYNFAVTKVKAGLTSASTSGNPAFDVNDDGVSIFSTTLTIDANETFSDSAATAAVLTGNPVTIAKGSVITVDIDTAGTNAKGAKIYIIGYATGAA